MNRILPGALAVLLLLAAGFFCGGVFGRLTIPAGSGLAGAGTAAIYALGGALAGTVLAIVGTVMLDRRRLWPFVGVSLALAAAAVCAFLLTP